MEPKNGVMDYIITRLADEYDNSGKSGYSLQDLKDLLKGTDVQICELEDELILERVKSFHYRYWKPSDGSMYAFVTTNDIRQFLKDNEPTGGITDSDGDIVQFQTDDGLVEITLDTTFGDELPTDDQIIHHAEIINGGKFGDFRRIYDF